MESLGEGFKVVEKVEDVHHGRTQFRQLVVVLVEYMTLFVDSLEDGFIFCYFHIVRQYSNM
jgi:hypothetical protein